jgi:riboflavin transporter FmnP
VNELYFKRKSVVIAGTALLGTLVFVLDWVLKMSGLKILFPYMPALRFDILGIVVLVSFFLFGFYSATTTSLILMFSIGLRDPFSGVMRFIAEFATILGVYLVLRARRPASNGWKIASIGSGILARVGVTAVSNVLLLPIFMSGFYASSLAVMASLPFIASFNVIQGAISILGGFLLYEAILLRFRNNEDVKFTP